MMCVRTPQYFFYLIQVDGQWAHWSDWSNCDVTCGHGHVTRMRNCSAPAPQYGGNNCTGDDTENTTCTLSHCPSNNKMIVYIH